MFIPNRFAFAVYARIGALAFTAWLLCWPQAAYSQGQSKAIEMQRWERVLGPPQGEWADPLLDLTWRSDLGDAMAEAKEDNRPLLVTLRCLPCKQCASFDQEVLEGGELLTPLLKRFITVRLSNAFELDARIFPYAGYQDFDLSWWAYLLSPEGQVYAIFGGRDEVSDLTRISAQALANTLRRVLDHHSDPRRPEWKLDGPMPDLLAARQGPRQEPGFKSWLAASPNAPDLSADSSACIHCHQLGEVLRQPAVDAGSFDVQRDVDVWPYPENVGIKLDRDDGLLVLEVRADSAAAKAGLQGGDQLAVAAGRRLFGQTDIRGVLHREADPAGSIHLIWKRGPALMQGHLKLKTGWRKTVLDWRMSISQGNIGPDCGFGFPLAGPERKEGLSIQPFFGRNRDRSPAYRAGLRPKHVIISVNGASPKLVGRAFLTWFRLNHRVGQEIALEVLEGEHRRTIRYVLQRY